MARKDSHIRIEDDELILSPLEADNTPFPYRYVSSRRRLQRFSTTS